MVKNWSLKLSNRFEVLSNLSQEEEDDKKSPSTLKPNASCNASKVDQAEEEACISQYDKDIDMSILTINVLYCKTKSQILLLEWMMLKNGEFQMANKMPDVDSMSLMEDPSQEEVSQPSSQDKTWECPVITCAKSYRYEKHLRNHVKKVHDEMDESFNPQEASTYDEDLSTQLPMSGRKRKNRDDDSDEEQERGEKPKREGRMDSIKEEDHLDYGLLDDSVNANTQDVREAAREAYMKAEKTEVDVGGLDESLEQEEARDMEEARKKIKMKDDLLHIRSAKMAEQEAELEEMKIVKDQMDDALTKVKGEKEELRKRAKKELEEKERLVKGMILKLKEMEKKRSVSPGKEQLKEDLERATAKMTNLTNRVTNLQKDLKNANKDRRKAEVDTGNYEKMRASLERTVLEMETVKRDLDELKREKAKMMKRIPCTRKECNNPKDCEYSHHLRYEDRSTPKEARWEKRVPCRFMSLPGGCNKSAEDCKFLHDGVVQMRRDTRRTERGPSIELISEAGPSWADHTREVSRRPPAKKMRGGGSNMNTNFNSRDQGNEAGGRERSRRLTPSWPSRRSSVASSGSAGGQTMSSTATTPTRRSRAESRTPEASRWPTRSRSPLRSRSRTREYQPRRMNQDQQRARPRSESQYKAGTRTRAGRDYSRSRQGEWRDAGRR